MPLDIRLDQKIAALAQTDPAAAAAYRLRYQSICPMCQGLATVTSEDIRTGERVFRCAKCQWTAKVLEAAFRGPPELGLRAICQAAIVYQQQATIAAVVARRTPRKWQPRGRGGRARAGEAMEAPASDGKGGADKATD